MVKNFVCRCRATFETGQNATPSSNSALQELATPLFSRRMSHLNPEQLARHSIDKMLEASGWAVQDYKAFDPSASMGIALREVPLKSGRCDYLLLVNRKPVGVVEAKKVGVTLSTVAEQSAHYAANLPSFLAATLTTSSLPFRYESTGVETFFRDGPKHG